MKKDLEEIISNIITVFAMVKTDYRWHSMAMQ